MCRLLEAEALTGRMLFHLLDGGTSLNPGTMPVKKKPLSARGRERQHRGKTGLGPKPMSSSRGKRQASKARGKKTSASRKKR